MGASRAATENTSPAPLNATADRLPSVASCYSCVQTSRLAELPFHERLYVGDGWRVSHAIRCALPGWLVIVPDQHVTSFVELTAAQASAMGPLIVRLSRALTEITGCSKTYVAMFAEAEGFQHLHLHVIPRAPGLAEELRGPRVFAYLHRPEREWVSADQMDGIAARLQPWLRGGG